MTATYPSIRVVNRVVCRINYKEWIKLIMCIVSDPMTRFRIKMHSKVMQQTSAIVSETLLRVVCWSGRIYLPKVLVIVKPLGIVIPSCEMSS
jgi:hypothetical protein